MKLYLHIGTEKTGSSYLQKLCALNRDFLRERGLTFPHAGKHENRLQTGTISPGNGKPLAELISAESWTEVTQWLATRTGRARKQDCDGLLVSNEVLFETLAGTGRVEQLILSAQAAGLVGLDALLVVRDPVDQALSLYKHRAKAGKAGLLPDWLATGYALPGALQSFVAEADQAQVRVHYRKYTSSSEALRDVFFTDWLGIESPPRDVSGPVNPSLTLSELRYISHISKVEPQTVPLLYDAFLQVPRSRKARNDELENWARACIGGHLQTGATFWANLSGRLPGGEALDPPAAGDTADAGSLSCSFSDEQLQAIAGAHRTARQWRHRFSTALRRHVRRPIGGLRTLLRSRQE